MKKIASLFLALSLVFCVFFNLSLDASAASSGTQDGLEVTITTDKTEYTSDEDIQVSLKIKNNNSYKVEGVSVETLLPDGLNVKNGNLTATNIVIEAGTSYETSVVAQSTKNVNVSEKTEPDDVGNAGDNSNIVLWMVLLVVATIGIVLTLKYEKTAKIMSLILCFTMVLTMLPITALAAENNSSLSLEKTIKVNKTDMAIKVVVKYNMNTNNSIDDVAQYYQDSAEQIVSVDAVNETNVLTEKEVYQLMQERGFTQFPITYEYNLEGNYNGEKNVSKDSNAKHPMYQTLYITDDGNVWSIFVIGKSIVANPAFYNSQLVGEMQVLIAEAGTLTSYDDTTNLFYVTVPKDAVVELMEIEKVSVETIKEITFEEVGNNE